MIKIGWGFKNMTYTLSILTDMISSGFEVTGGGIHMPVLFKNPPCRASFTNLFVGGKYNR